MSYKFNILFQKDEHGYFAYCPELKGCHSQGDTFEEAQVNIREAVELYVETMTKDEINELLPSKELITTTMEVELAKVASYGCKRSGKTSFGIRLSFAKNKGKSSNLF